VAALLAACGGFLLAVLWMDLMFDVQVLRHRREAELPEPVVASIAGYYRRVTTEASPMGRLVGVVMVVALVAALTQLAVGPARGWSLLALGLAAAPIALAAARVVPNAVRLGARAGSAAEESALARGICRDHLLCFASILAFVALEVWLGIRARA
jgi:hypothetical protein